MRDLFRIALRRLEKYRKVHGIAGSLRIVLSRGFWRRLSPAHRRRQAAGAAREAQYDLRFGEGIVTAGIIPLTDLLDVESENWMHGVQCEPIQIESLAEYLAPLNLDYGSTVFVDFGSGKGRAVLLASALPFRKVVGVEFSAGLTRMAEDNVRRYRDRKAEAELVCADAVSYAVPDAPLVLYFYNPFHRPVMERVVRNVTASHRRHPRRIVVLYFGPVCADLWDAAGFLEKVLEDPRCVVYDTRRASARPR